MLRNYLAAGLRNLWRNRANAAINVIGLADARAKPVEALRYE